MSDETIHRLPVHSLGAEEFPFAINDLAYKNPYDYHRPHRHTYYEIFLITKGGGSQIIDFKDIPLVDYSCYIVFPQQIHHVRRHPASAGTIFQFNEQNIPGSSLAAMADHLLVLRNSSVVFENDVLKYDQLKDIFQLVLSHTNRSSLFKKETALLMLQMLLYKVIELSDSKPVKTSGDDRQVIDLFLKMIDHRFREEHLVKAYVKKMNINEKKLAELTKKFLGMTPLQVIHNRILLEVKRMLSLKQDSFKEISYFLGFENAAAFNAFVKGKTGLTPTELERQLAEIHK
jgi:AraC family transcriptional regulator, transcriptional activator of pobA